MRAGKGHMPLDAKRASLFFKRGFFRSVAHDQEMKRRAGLAGGGKRRKAPTKPVAGEFKKTGVAPRMFLREIPVPETADLATMAKGHDGAIRDFVLAIREGRKPECDGEDNILSLAMVHAAIASAGSGRREAVATGA